MYFFALNKRTADDKKCLTWYAAEKSKLADIKKRWKETTACPCDVKLAATDTSWVLDWQAFVSNTASMKLCYYERNPASDSTQVRCCTGSTAEICRVPPEVMYKLWYCCCCNAAPFCFIDVLYIALTMSFTIRNRC